MSRRRIQRWGMPADRQDPLGARIALLMVLVNIFIWLGFRYIDPLLVSFGGTLLALCGLLLAKRAEARIRRNQGRIAGEHLATIAFWGNAILLGVNILLFCYLLATGLMSGQLL